MNESADLKAIADSCNLAPGSYKKMTHEEILKIFQSAIKKYPKVVCHEVLKRQTKIKKGKIAMKN